MLCEACELREGSAGAGRWRGGLGVSYKVRLLRDEAKASFMMDHGRTGPFGMLGGESGALNDIRVSQGGTLSRPAYGSKGNGFELSPGDWVLVNTPGGGGLRRPRGTAAGADRARSAARISHPRTGCGVPARERAVIAAWLSPRVQRSGSCDGSIATGNEWKSPRSACPQVLMIPVPAADARIVRLQILDAEVGC